MRGFVTALALVLALVVDVDVGVGVGVDVPAVHAAPAGPAPAADLGGGALTMDDAVRVALERNRDVIAARLEIEAAQLDVVAARIYPNPVASYSLGNLVLGTGNSQGGQVSPGFISEPVHAIGVSEVIDIWAKRSARASAAERGVEQRRLQVEDALREIIYAVRSAFAEVAREQLERQLAHDIADRYGETVRLSQARFHAGDISEAELRRVELEGLRYTNAVVDADLQMDLARERLARLLGLRGVDLPGRIAEIPDGRRAYAIASLIALALERRPDVRAAAAAHNTASAQLDAARREVYPDLTLGASYTHSQFTIAGDNPNTLGLGVSLPLPLFDRNQANIGRSTLDIRRADNDLERLRLAVSHDVTEAVRKADRVRSLLDVFEGATAAPGPASSASPAPPAGPVGGGASIATGGERNGMLARAETSLRVAEKSYQAGAISLLELLDAQRTYLDVRGQYLRAVYDYRQATIDVNHAVGTEVK
jgi:outer membrane protein, heavy metal efflux system